MVRAGKAARTPARAGRGLQSWNRGWRLTVRAWPSGSLCRLEDAAETVGQSLSDGDVEHVADRGIRLDEDRLEPGRLADHLTGQAAFAVDQDLRVLADRGAVEGEAMLGDAGLEPLQSVVHHLWRHRSFHLRRRSARPGAIFETIGRSVTHLIDNG